MSLSDHDQPSEFYLALATSKKFDEALRYKKLYEELSEAFMGLIGETAQLLKEADTTPEQRRKAARILEKAHSLYSARIKASDESKHLDDQDLTRQGGNTTWFSHVN